MNHREILQALLDGETLYRENEPSTLLKIGESGSVVCSTDNGISWLAIANVKIIRADMINKLWKIKPKTININGFEVPEPVRKPLPVDTIYYRVYLLGISSFYWKNDNIDRKGLNLGLLHLSKEAAQIHLDALLSFTKLENKDE